MSCKSNKTPEAKKTNSPSIVFETKKTEKRLINDNKTLVLILNYQLTKNLPVNFDYSVVNLSTKEVLKKGTFTGMRMEWYTLDKIKGYLYQGIIKKQDDVIDEKNINKPNDNFILINLNNE
jgi:hypothetical protein